MTISRFNSNQEFFGALSGLIGELGAAHPAAVSELDRGLRCVNGLTDGWALLMESIQKVESDHSSAFRQSQRDTLNDVRVAAHSLVYRR